MKDNDDALLDEVLMFNGGPLGTRVKQRFVAKFILPMRSISNYKFSKRNLENILMELLTLKEN